MDLDPAQFSFVQFTTIVFAFLVLYEQVRIYRIDKQNWKKVLNGTVWAAHLSVFYICLILDSYNITDFHVIFGPSFFSVWSQYLRLHSAVAFYYISRSSHIFTSITKKTENIISKYKKTSEGANVK